MLMYLKHWMLMYEQMIAKERGKFLAHIENRTRVVGLPGKCVTTTYGRQEFRIKRALSLDWLGGFTSRFSESIH